MPTGDIVGTTDTQTLTNKTINGDNNTITNLAHGSEVDNPSSGVHGVTGNVVGTTDTQTLTNKTLTSPKLNENVVVTVKASELNGLLTGWIPAGETWTYAGADDPTFTFKVSADVTGKYSAGMRIKLTQTTVKYFIITKVAYSSPNTTITVYGGTDYDLANATITSPYYSTHKAPLGFPMSPDKWSQTKTHTTQNYSTTSPTSWQSIGINISLTIPIGVWNVSYWALIYAEKASGNVEAYSTLSTTTSSETNTDFTCCNIGMTTITGGWHTKTGVLTLTTKGVYYLIGKSTGTSIGILGNKAKGVIKATCAYL